MTADKVVLITGASTGIGRVTAELLAENGYRVYGTSRRPQSAEKFLMLALDVDSDDSVRACVDTVLTAEGRIDALINNAGWLLLGLVEETTVPEAKALFETNFFGVHRMVRAVLPHMRNRGDGRIITVGSLGGPCQRPRPRLPLCLEVRP